MSTEPRTVFNPRALGSSCQNTRLQAIESPIMTHIAIQLRRLVIERAKNRCEYCCFPQTLVMLAFEMEHIIAEKHGGKTSAENWALSCPYCNRAKGTDL